MSILSEKEKRYYDYTLLLLICLLLAFLVARKILGVGTAVFHDKERNKLEITQSPDYLWNKAGS